MAVHIPSAPTFTQTLGETDNVSCYNGGVITISSANSVSIVYGNSSCGQNIGSYAVGPGYPTSTTYVAPFSQEPGSQIVAYGIGDTGIIGPPALWEAF